MKKASSSNICSDVPCGRLTRARAAVYQASGAAPPFMPLVMKPVKEKQKVNTKRAAGGQNIDPQTNVVPCKRRAVLKDVSNTCKENLVRPCGQSVKMQSTASQQIKSKNLTVKQCSNLKSSKLAPKVSVGSTKTHSLLKNKIPKDMQEIKVLKPKEVAVLVETHDNLLPLQCMEAIKDGETICSAAFFEEHSTGESPRVSVGSTKAHGLLKNKIPKDMQDTKALQPKEFAVPMETHDNLLPVQCMEVIKGGETICAAALLEDHCSREPLGFTDSKNGNCSDLNYIDIDVDIANPQMCCAYASEVYINLHAAELVRRPICNFIETLQRDITQSMRGILIDWLVEVAEEYKLVPDTLYLTVYIIDRFLSQNFIERQRLQLLGITCMLIASKYEEICAPRVEEFCFITDNTYAKSEVLKMESEVLNYLGFQLSVPTIKTFLRRFLRAAQASNKIPSLALGYLANYLAELTLVEYNFVKFLPSIIAASAIFLARWTLDQSDHPWNQTLEHYTLYKAMDLKVTVCALQELQANSKSCPLNAIREKYKQQKFESVAALASPKLPQSLFC